MRVFVSKMSFVVLALFCSVLLFAQDGKAESVGKGARIIEYDVPDQARFHMGAQVGTTVRLAAEATGTKILSDITFTSSDTSVCSIQKEGDYWLVSRLREGAAVIRMSCKADQDTVVRTLLMSNLTPLFDESAGEEEEEDDDIIKGILRSGSTVYLGCSDVEGITSYDTEIKDVVQGDKAVEVVAQCGDFYRVELEDESTFGDSDEMWGYVKKSAVYIPVKRIVMREEAMVFEENTESLGAVVYPRIATNPKLLFSTSNTNAATVNEYGIVQGVHRGRAVITAVSAENKTICAKCELTVKAFIPVTGIVIDPQTLEIEDGTMGKIEAHVLPEDATEPAFTWSVSAEDVLKMDSKGRYQAVKPGQAVVTATSKEGGFRASCIVTVKRVEAKGVFIQNVLSVDVGETKTPVWRMLPANASDQRVIWSSENPEIARVDKAGKVTGLRTGETNLTITTAEGGFRGVCRVTVERMVKNIELNNTSFTMTLGSSKHLQAKITPQTRTKEKIIWRSETPSAVTVTQKGKIKAVGVGTAKILVYDAYTGAFDYAMVHVKANLKKPKLSGKRKGKKVVLTWKKVENATGYTIFQYKNKRYVKLKELGKGKTKYIIKKAKKGMKYRIQATYNSQGQKETSKYSSVIKVK